MTEQGAQEAMAEQGAKEAMTEQGVKEAMAEQGAKEAMEEQGAKEAMVEQGAQEAMAEQGAQEAMAEQAVQGAREMTGGARLDQTKTGGTWSVRRQVGPRPQPYWLPKLEPTAAEQVVDEPEVEMKSR